MSRLLLLLLLLGTAVWLGAQEVALKLDVYSSVMDASESGKEKKYVLEV